MPLLNLLADQNYVEVEATYGSQRMFATAGFRQLATLGVPGYGSPIATGRTGVSSWDYLIQQTQQALLTDAWRKLVIDKSAATDAVTLQFTADEAFKAIHEKGPEGFDLSMLDPGQVNGEHLVMLLRCISTWKANLPDWNYAIEVAKVALLSEGKDPQDVLFGMI
jgi:hypothetical protein